MERKTFSITINAPKEKVWDILWSDSSYREWTSVFAPGSYARTDWKKGSKALFLGEEGSGMLSTIADARPNEFMSIRHLGVVKNGVEELSKEWGGAMENYTLEGGSGKTELTVDMDISEEYMDYFVKTWPKALDKVKELSEKN